MLMYIDRNYKRKALLLLPSELQRPLIAAFAEVTGAEIQNVYDRLLALYHDLNYKINHTSQVCFMETVLNDALDPIQRRIEIHNTVISSAIVPRLYDRIHESPIVLGVQILNDREHYNSGDYDMQVVVPQLADLTDDEINQLHANMLFYKLAGKRYLLTQTRIVE